MTVVDISNASSPAKSSEVRAGHVADIGAAGPYLYFTDNQVAKVYDLASPSAPARTGFMDAGGILVALDVTNVMWVADAEHVRCGPLQSVSAPGIVSGSEEFTWSQNAQTGELTWEMSWRTKEWTDPNLMYVVLRDDVTNGEGCMSVGSAMEVKFGDEGVTTCAKPDMRGGYKNTVRWVAGDCVPMCRYYFVGHSAINDETGGWATSAEKGYKFTYCPGI